MLSISTLSKQMYRPKDSYELSQAQRLFHGRGHAFAGLEHVVLIGFLPFY
jgi:hypothetical protein